MSTFARRIREARAKVRLSQLQLAEAVGVSQGTVSKWEAGQQQPDLQTIIKIAEVVKVNAMHLAFRDEEHALAQRGWAKQIVLKGSISQELTEQPYWDETDWVDMSIPIPAEWLDLSLFAMLVKDNSANLIFPKNSIVVIAQLKLDKVDAKNGDVLLYSLKDPGGSEIDLRRNMLVIYNKMPSNYPILLHASNMHLDAPVRLRYRDNLDLFAEGGYEGVGLLGLAVGSFSNYQPGRFLEKMHDADMP